MIINIFTNSSVIIITYTISKIIIWFRLNTTNSSNSVTYETGLNSLLSVVDSYQVTCSLTSLTKIDVSSHLIPGGGAEGGADRGGVWSEGFTHSGRTSCPRLPPYLLLQVIRRLVFAVMIHLQESEHLRRRAYARLKDGWGWH